MEGLKKFTATKEIDIAPVVFDVLDVLLFVSSRIKAA